MAKILLIWLFLISPALALNRYKVESYRIIDADTIDLIIYLDFDIYINKSIRLNNLDAPEKNTVAGKEVSRFVQLWMGRQTILTTENLGRDKYQGRYIGKIHGDKEELGRVLIDNGLAKIYDINKEKPKWSAEELENVKKLASELIEKEKENAF